jgi:hypothetical protein
MLQNRNTVLKFPAWLKRPLAAGESGAGLCCSARGFIGYRGGHRPHELPFAAFPVGVFADFFHA